MTQPPSKAGSRPESTFRVWMTLGAFLGFLWYLLLEGKGAGWWFGLLVVALALGLRKAMPIPIALRNFSLFGVLRFIPYFLGQSLWGGMDVAWRAVHPRLPLSPNVYVYRFRLGSEGARVFMAQVISLMPGTLACRVGDRRMTVHVLSGSREDFVRSTAALELHASRIFCEPMMKVDHG